MAYVKRNTENKIIAFSRWDNLDGFEAIDENSQELKDYLGKTGSYLPENTMSYTEKRRRQLSEGGYGTWQEQLEMIHEQGFDQWLIHCQKVKQNFPQTEV